MHDISVALERMQAQIDALAARVAALEKKNTPAITTNDPIIPGGGPGEGPGGHP
jgi:hypothetical protein